MSFQKSENGASAGFMAPRQPFPGRVSKKWYLDPFILVVRSPTPAHYEVFVGFVVYKNLV